MEMDCNLTVLGEFIQALSMCLRKNPLKQIMVCFPFTKITLYRPLRVLGAFLVQGKSLRPGSGRGAPDPAFPLLFQANPESRTLCRRFPESRFFFRKNSFAKGLILYKLMNLRCRSARLVVTLILRVLWAKWN